ncbi:MAG: 2,3-bisphosphoglycerate-independent phosphoglycerate mutase [Anaerovoracaceae bacterium]|jgi:2,3-bisphosphoglycerate-independent phosphoglycerate mutase
MKRPTMLMILDGFGVNRETYGNAIAQADTPHLDRIFKEYPHAQIMASGEDVGLPAGQMGNSEVGHLNIGAGRIVYQDLTRISRAIDDGSFFSNPVLNEAMDHVIGNGSALHLTGLLSDGGVHSHIGHLLALIDMAKRKGVKDVRVNAILDGRDVPPRSALPYIEQLEQHMKDTGVGRITMISGRYYAMDRDNRWDREKLAYDSLTDEQGYHADTAKQALEMAYSRDENDEFVKPTVVGDHTKVSAGDSIIMFNFRPDRAREITREFTEDDFDGFDRGEKIQDLYYVTMTEYDATLKNVHVAFPPEHVKNTLGEYASSLGLHQLRIAETEKYAHVTFFFNGGVEKPNKNEDRILIPSPKVATYDLQPEMSAYIVKDKVIEQIKTGKYDLIILNFANADMVGHTGVMEAAIKAIEALDVCVNEIKDVILECGGQILLTADHGNADVMLDKDGNPVTKHSTNPVPLVNISDDPLPLREGGRLADLAPTLLDMMGLDKPQEMTGRSLLEK